MKPGTCFISWYSGIVPVVASLWRGKYEVTLMVERGRREEEGRGSTTHACTVQQRQAAKCAKAGPSDNQPRGSGLAKAVGGVLVDCWRWTMRPSGRKWP